VTAVLPAEYGVDPTGVGKALGLTQLAGTKPSGNQTAANATSLYKYRLTWPVVTDAPQSRTGYTSEGTTTNVALTLETQNTTRVEALLTWNDDNRTGDQPTKPDLFELQVIGPDETAGESDLGRNGADGGGNVTAELLWRAPPAPQETRAATDDEAARQAGSLVEIDRTAFGEWTIRITLVDAGDVDASGLAFPGPAGDAGNDWDLTITVESFRFDREGLNESKEREDRVRLDIAPGTGLEYKFDMEEGASMEYAWNTTGGPLYFDLHGEARGDTTGAFTSHKSGSSERDAGTFTAPFAGTHGWFWENQGTDPVSVELVTTGVYKIIGRK
jgi:hypothetical protein